MSRAAIAGVRELVDLSQVGQFDLPPELVRTYEGCVQLQALVIPPLDVLDVDQASQLLVTAAMAGESLDLLELGQRVDRGNTTRAALTAASLAKRAAEEKAGDQLATIAADLTERIITESLKPALKSVLEQAAEPAQLVHGSPLTAQDLSLRDTNETRRIRAAMRQLQPLGRRRAAIAQARIRANRVGSREPEHDAEHRFATLHRPLALSPGWKAPARFPSPEIPQDQLEALVWMVTTGKPCEPWIPTVGEQDEAWLDVFGEWFNQQKAAASAWPRVFSN